MTSFQLITGSGGVHWRIALLDCVKRSKDSKKKDFANFLLTDFTVPLDVIHNFVAYERQGLPEQ